MKVMSPFVSHFTEHNKTIRVCLIELYFLQKLLCELRNLETWLWLVGFEEAQSRLVAQL